METTNTGNINAEALTPQEEQIQFLKFQAEKREQDNTDLKQLVGNKIHESLNLMTAWRESITAQIAAYNAAVEAAESTDFPKFSTGESLESIEEVLNSWVNNFYGDYDDQIIESIEITQESERGWGGSNEITISANADVNDTSSLMDSIKEDILKCFKESRENNQ